MRGRLWSLGRIVTPDGKFAPSMVPAVRTEVHLL